MAVEVVTGSAFAGKRRFVLAEIERRERAGELGLVALDWTALYLALFPGEQSQFRDEAIGDTGAPRLTGYTFEVVAAAILTREIAGFVTTNSPERALALADRFGGPLLEIDVDVGDVAHRAEQHMRTLRRTVARAARAALWPKCRRAAVSYFRESHRLTGRARTVRTSGGGYKVGEVKRPFDRALWEKGLTPRAREAVAELKSLGNPEPDPSAVMAFLLKNPVEV